MIEIFLVFLSLSVSGSILALLLLAIKPLVRKRLSQTWQYYIWLLVAIRFVLPFSPEISLIGELSNHLQPISSYSGKADTDIVLPAAAGISAAQPADILKPSNRSPLKAVLDSSTKVTEKPFYFENCLNFLWIPWLITALLLLLYKIIGYHSYIYRVKLKAKFPVDHKLLCLYQEELAYMGIKKALPLLINEQIASPMLIGFFQPAVILPNANIEENAMRHTFRHELIHYKRLDTLYKWFIQIMICLHWYNPMVYFIRKEINRCCELSCDEIVIKNMDVDNRILYGDTLINSLNVPVKRKNNISLTLGENASLIKERLDMIMNFQKNRDQQLVQPCC
jgi:Antirepressor regulating drug resistance, predicted signal transduction N-terminal membrane component